MSDMVSDKAKLDERIEYEKLNYHGLELRPVARLTGKRFSKAADNLIAAGAFAKLQPEELIVANGKEEYSLSLAQSTRDSLRSIAVTSVLVSVLCIALCVLSGRVFKAVNR